MTILQVDFAELCQRHLHRHARAGINILHLVAVFAIYLCIYGLFGGIASVIAKAAALQPTELMLNGILAGLTLPWLAIVAMNIPFRVTAASVVTVVLLLAVRTACSGVPFWCWILIIPAMHRFQLLSHRWYPEEHDMRDFQSKYPRGFGLFVLLSVYELPILLNYLFFGCRRIQARDSVNLSESVSA